VESDSGHGNVRFSGGGKRLKSKLGNGPRSSVNGEPDATSRSACDGDG